MMLLRTVFLLATVLKVKHYEMIVALATRLFLRIFQSEEADNGQVAAKGMSLSERNGL
jgi:hypothetical protein